MRDPAPRHPEPGTQLDCFHLIVWFTPVIAVGTGIDVAAREWKYGSLRAVELGAGSFVGVFLAVGAVIGLVLLVLWLSLRSHEPV